MYSIKAVAHATGLTVETLRAWERRYGVIRPERDATGRRVYGAADVVRLRRLREATERGHPIGRIAGLTDAQLSALLADLPERQNRAAANAF
ncbi:MAG TPA: MerR family transcriptional regulator, partial [Steroidobacteraceae bacterium]|nr:MerR family transcriptional regulator [Steroidobacteraceae bacterium]